MRAMPTAQQWLALLAVAWLPLQAVAQPLGMDEVASSVRRHHPVIAAAVAQERASRGELLSARGAFDPELEVYGELRTGDGYYETRRAGVSVSQATPLWGTEVWAGYRIGVGEQDRWLSYDYGETNDSGELRIGARVPLWRNGPLDSRRASRRRAELGVDRAEASRLGTELDVTQDAFEAYWKWVAAGANLRIADQLLALAQTRLVQVQARIAAGAEPPIDGLEAEQSVLTRRASQVSARRSLEAATLKLAMYVRDADGRPIQVDASRLPVDTPEPQPFGDVEATGVQVLSCHPVLVAARAGLEAQQVSVDLARARRAPQVDLSVQYSRDFGSGSETLAGHVFDARLELGMPLGLRGARGDLDEERAEFDAYSEQLRYKEDQILLALRDTDSARRAADERHALTVELASTSEALAEAERARFDAGSSSLLRVNIREQRAASASAAAIDTLAALWATRVRWDALTSCLD